MAVRHKKRGLIYLRRSTDHQESSLEKQLTWALDAASKEGVIVDATLDDLQYMLSHGLHAYKSLRIDDAITGADLERPGLKALVANAMDDPTISHIFVFKRDRLGRPDSPVEMMVIEVGLLRNGVMLVFSDGKSNPSLHGDDSEILNLFMMLLGYYRSGKFLSEHAEQIIRTKSQLACKGYWTGGNAPYGFTRAVINERGEILEELPPGKGIPRQDGCHVVIIPQDKAKIAIWGKILRLKEKGWGYKRIARYLNKHGIPSPGAGQIRKKHGISREVSGRWGQSAVQRLCENRAILGLLDYGRHSHGKHRRLGKDGPRPLEATDRNQRKKPKIITNDPSLVITSKLPQPEGPLFDSECWEKIHAKIKKRSKTQQGISRARDPALYPLSCRLSDLSCMATMYGRKQGGRSVYVCGRYMTTSGDECKHNSVDADAILGFSLDTLLELVDRLGAREELRQKLIERATCQQPEDPFRLQREQQRTQLQTTISRLEQELDAAERNYTIEKEQTFRPKIRKQITQIEQELKNARDQLDTIPEHKTVIQHSPEEEADRALQLLDDIQRIACDPAARAEILPLMQRLGLKIGLRFASVLKKTRPVQRLAGGVIVFGDTPFPVNGGTNSSNDSPVGNTSPDSDDLDLPPYQCENAQNRNVSSGSKCMPPEEKCPKEGVSFTKALWGEPGCAGRRPHQFDGFNGQYLRISDVKTGAIGRAKSAVSVKNGKPKLTSVHTQFDQARSGCQDNAQPIWARF